MKYVIIGAGGTGGILGFYMTKAGKDVTLIARNAHLAAMKEQGLTVRHLWDGTTETVPVKAENMETYESMIASAGEAAKPDVILVCVKGYSLDNTVPFVQKIAKKSTIVIPILNIYGTGSRLQKKLPELLVTDGCIYVSANIEGPGPLSSMEQQSELKESLLTMLGLSGRTDIEIGTVPDPDLSAIRAVSVENYLQTAISNDPTWVSEMKSKVTGTDNRELRKQRISEAAQNAEISLRSAYENLQNALSQYEAAESAYSAAKQAWDTVQKKQAAGMLSKNAYLSGQASWLSGEAAMNTAKLNLVSAYTSYVWQVAGVETGASGGTAAAAGSSGGGAPAGR